jgi:amidase
VSGAPAATCGELAFAGLAGQAIRLARGEVSSAELVQRSLDAIAATQGTLNAFRCVREPAAHQEAEQADRRLAAGERAPLLGVPVAIKDDVDVAGETTEFGCRGAFEPKRADCEAVRRLKAAGAVIVGKTTSPELGQWPITEGSAFGVTRNPWHPGHTPGGSSGGSAAAVAAGLVAGALGSDGLGSVRIPAAWTHLVGIKPQRGRISTWPDREAFNGLTCIGPLARTVADAALLLDAVAGNHAGDAHCPPSAGEAFADAARREPRRLRIAVALKPPYTPFAPAPLHPVVQHTIRRLADVLAGLGHHVQDAELPYGVFGVGALPRSVAGVSAWTRRLPEPAVLDPRTRHNARVGWLLGGPVLRAARALEAPMRWQMSRVFTRFDVVLTPTTAQPPLPVGAIDRLSDWETDKLMVASCPYTWPWNVLGWPAVNVPAGLTDEGLPLGAQLVGPANSELELISLAAVLEDAERWHERRPPNTVGHLTHAIEGDPA